MYTHQHSSFTPDMLFFCLSHRRHSYRTGQDIENCGTCRDCACIIYRYVAGCLFIVCIFMTLCLRLGQWGHRECQSVRAQDCGHHELSFKACWGLSRCSVTRTARCIVGTALRKHRSRSDHFIHTEVCSRRRTHIHGHTYCHWNVFSWTVSKELKFESKGIVQRTSVRKREFCLTTEL